MGNNLTRTLKLTATCKYARILEPNQGDYDDQPVYSIALVLTDAQFAKLKEKGFRGQHKADADGDKICNFKRRTLARDGARQVPALSVVGRDKLPVTESVGNGSEVVVILELNDYDNKFGKGTAFRLGAVQVIDHVLYEKVNVHLDAFDQLDDAVDSSEEVI